VYLELKLLTLFSFTEELKGFLTKGKHKGLPPNSPEPLAHPQGGKRGAF
jgi:hypothetical protein